MGSIWSIAAVASCIFVLPAFANADDDVGTPKHAASSTLVLRWIDAKGEILPGPRVEKMEWVWAKERDDDVEPTPALRLHMQTDQVLKLKLKKIEADGARVIEPPNLKGELALDLYSTRAVVRLVCTDVNEKPVELTLALPTSLRQAFILVHQSCHDLGVHFDKVSGETANLFIGVLCKSQPDKLAITVFKSSDANWSSKTPADKTSNRFHFEGAKPQDGSVPPVEVFRVGVEDANKKFAEYVAIYSSGDGFAARLNWTIGLGASIYSYSETKGSIGVSETALTARVGATFRYRPKITIAGNAFGTLIPLTHSPGDLSSVRYYGLNGRVGYRLPIALGALEYTFLTGLYFWKMSQGTTSTGGPFGVQSMGGPQFYLLAAERQAGHRAWWAYGKIALIAAGTFGVSGVSNRELAVGGGYELTVSNPKPWSITVDLASTEFSESDNGMKLLSITAGVQKGL